MTGRQFAPRHTADADQILVHSFVHGFSSLSGAEVVAEVRDLLDSCETYQLDHEEVTRVVLGEHPMTAPPGPDDFFSYCEGTAKSAELHVCYALLAHENLVSVVTNARNGPLQGVQQELEIIVPLAAMMLQQA